MNDYLKYLRSSTWNKLRKRRLKIANYRCENCDAATKLEVHHKTYKRFGGDERITDLLALCKHCHGDFDLRRKHGFSQRIPIYKLVQSWYRIALDKIRLI